MFYIIRESWTAAQFWVLEIVIFHLKKMSFYCPFYIMYQMYNLQAKTEAIRVN